MLIYVTLEMSRDYKTKGKRTVHKQFTLVGKPYPMRVGLTILKPIYIYKGTEQSLK